jgi:hypothetical protein
MNEDKTIEPLSEGQISEQAFRELIMDAQNVMMNSSDTFMGEMINHNCPLTHSFGNGCYVREIFMPAGTLIISKIHKKTHPYFVMTGSASVLTSEGVVLIKAPHYGITKAGTKRALLIHQDMIWITVHVTDKTNLKDIEEEIIAKTFEEFDKGVM